MLRRALLVLLIWMVVLSPVDWTPFHAQSGPTLTCVEADTCNNGTGVPTTTETAPSCTKCWLRLGGSGSWHWECLAPPCPLTQGNDNCKVSAGGNDCKELGRSCTTGSCT